MREDERWLTVDELLAKLTRFEFTESAIRFVNEDGIRIEQFGKIHSVPLRIKKKPELE